MWIRDIINLLRGRKIDVRKDTLDGEDRVARIHIEAAKHLGAKTPKQAAEITAGREITPQEWDKVRGAWERNWS